MFSRAADVSGSSVDNKTNKPQNYSAVSNRVSNTSGRSSSVAVTSKYIVKHYQNAQMPATRTIEDVFNSTVPIGGSKDFNSNMVNRKIESKDLNLSMQMLPLKDRADNYNSVAGTGGVTPGNSRLGKTHLSVSPQPQMNQIGCKMKEVAESKNTKTWNISTKVKKPIYTKSQIAAREAEEKKAALLLAKTTPVTQRTGTTRTRTGERNNMVASSVGEG